MQPSNQPTAAKSTSPFQFKLRTLFLFVAYVAFMLGWMRWFEIRGVWDLFPGYYGLCAVGLILFAAWTNPVRDQSSSAWNFLIAGWYLTAASVLDGFFRSFHVLNTAGRMYPGHVQEGIYKSVVFISTLPLFVSIPVIYILVVKRPCKLNRVTLCLLASLLLVLIDMLLLAFLSCSTVSPYWS